MWKAVLQLAIAVGANLLTISLEQRGTIRTGEAESPDRMRLSYTREIFTFSCLVREVEKQVILCQASTDKGTPA